jgi:ABC-type lipoprotein export system ATPase subunit
MITMDKIVLQTAGLGRSYRVGREIVHALENVEMAVAQGEFVAIVGPSGSGKSTLLNLLGGLDQPTSGNVLLDGHDLANYNEEQLAALRRQKLGFIFQRHDLFPELLVRENVEFPLLLNGALPDERRQRADSLLELVGLPEKAEHLPEELSGGQQQRVGIARSLANMPLILLADEPTGNLDSATATEIIGVLIDLVHRQGLTLIMVTHDPEVAGRADRILTMLDGRLSAQVNEVRQ